MSGTALRICDLLRLRWADVYDFDTSQWRTHLTISEGKTGKRKAIALNKQAIAALRLCFAHRRDDYIFSNGRRAPAPISRVQAWRIVKIAARAVGASGRVSPYSLRKSFGYLAWQSGVLPVVLMDIFNHSNFEITRRYLGIAQDDRDQVYLGVAVF